MRCLIKLILIMTIVLGGIAGTVYWMYRAQAKEILEKANELFTLKMEINSTKAKLTNAEMSLKKRMSRLNPVNDGVLRTARKRILELEGASRKLREFQELEFNGTKIIDPASLERLLKKLEKSLESEKDGDAKN